MNEEYRTYNKAIVIVNGYTITNIQTKGLPSNNCGCHLESITIDSPPVGFDNPQGKGTTGTVVLIDYADAVFKNLIGHLSNYMDATGSPIKGVDASSFCPPIYIAIYTYTNVFSINAHILDWNMTFTGTTPSITLSWSTIAPTNSPSNPIEHSSHYDTPHDLAQRINELIKQEYSDINAVPTSGGVLAFDVVDAAGNKISLEDTKFANPEGVLFVMSGASSGNHVYDALQFLAANMVTADDNQYPFDLCEYAVNTNNKKIRYYLRVRAPVSRDPSTDDIVSSSLLFVQNGNWKPFEIAEVNKQKYTIIPMTSFSFKTSLKQASMQYEVRGNINGNSDANGNQSAGSTEEMARNAKSNSLDPQSQAVTISFDCYNVMCFSRNDLEVPISFLVYNELGHLHPVCSSMKNSKEGIPAIATVKSCSYSLKGAVVVASVEATMVFNSIVTSIREAQEVETDASKEEKENEATAKSNDSSLQNSSYEQESQTILQTVASTVDSATDKVELIASGHPR